jgi:hypothetical protein
MALNQSSLASALQAIFDGTADTSPADGHADGTPTSASDAGSKLAKAYTDYAAGGTFGGGTVSAGVGSKQSALATTLGGALTVPGVAATHAAAWAAGVTTFWLGVPVAGVPSGATIGCPGAAALTVALTAVFSNLANTPATAAASLAAALHTATATTTAAVAPPPGTTLTIT